MTPASLVAELWAAGFRMWADAGLIFIEPASRLTALQRERLKHCREAVLGLLPGRPIASATEEDAIRTELARIMGQEHPDFPQALALALADPASALHGLSLTLPDAIVGGI